MQAGRGKQENNKDRIGLCLILQMEKNRDIWQ